MSNEIVKAGTSTPTIIDFRRDIKKYPRLCCYPREQAEAEMAKIVTNAFMYRGQQAEPNQIHFIASALIDEILSDTSELGMRYITFAEISLAVKKAVLSGDLYGISVASLFKVLADYIKNEGCKAEEEIDRQVRMKRQEALNRSSVTPMLKTFAGAMLKKMNE